MYNNISLNINTQYWDRKTVLILYIAFWSMVSISKCGPVQECYALCCHCCHRNSICSVDLHWGFLLKLGRIVMSYDSYFKSMS